MSMKMFTEASLVFSRRRRRHPVLGECSRGSEGKGTGVGGLVVAVMVALSRHKRSATCTISGLGSSVEPVALHYEPG